MIKDINKETMGSRTLPQSPPQRFWSTMNDDGLFAGRAIGDMLIHCIISFDGQISEKRMARAVRLTLDAEPILGCRFVPGWWRMRWERRTDLDHLGLFRLALSADTEEDISGFLTVPADPCEEPQIQALLLRSDRDTLCIKVNHVAADAAGVKRYACLLASIYRRLAYNPEYRPEPNPDGTRSMRQVSRLFDVPDKLRIVRRTFRDLRNLLSPRVNSTIPLFRGNPSDRTFVIRRIAHPQFQAIKAHGRRRGATINDMILTAVFRSLSDIIRPDSDMPIRLMTTADLRRYLPTGKAGAICNLSGVFCLKMNQYLEATFDDTLEQVCDRMNFIKGDFIGLGSHPIFVLPAKILPASWTRPIGDWMGERLLRSGNDTPPGLTNMGQIDKERLVFGEVGVSDAFLTAPVLFPPLFIIGISGFGESLTMSVGFCGSAVNTRVVEQVLDRVESKLRSLPRVRDKSE